MPKKYVDIGIVVPLLEEFERLRAIFPTTSDRLDGTQFQARLDLGVEDMTAVAFLQDAMGKASSSRAASNLLNQYDVGVLVVLGIAAGLSDDVSVGDVCYSSTIIDVLENSKVSDGIEGSKITFNPQFLNTDRILGFSFKYLKLGKDAVAVYEDWRLECYYRAKALAPGEFIGRKSRNEIIGLPDFHEGPIVCGAVSKSEVYNSSLEQIDRKLLALETESGGPFRVAEDSGRIPAVAIRGICDYGDKNKGKLEEQTNGSLRQIAADNAILFFKAQLRNPQFREYLLKRRANVEGHSPQLFAAIEVADRAAAGRKFTSDLIDRQLRELSPEYATKPSGYRLPVPRIRRSASDVSVSPEQRQNEDPVSILEAVVVNRATTIQVPRTYPDKSLPWIVAAELMLIEIEKRKIIPIVVQGDDLRPPSHGIRKVVDSEILDALDCGELVPVFVIDGVPLHSKSRTDFIISELSTFEEARIVILVKAEVTLTRLAELVVRVGASEYVLGEISFAEMSSFLQRNFNMRDQEAGVLALRLQDTFDQFNLNAHPSYFAGVAGDVLMSLLHANRRAELIQLAVDGFLSFVVATDKNSIVLSRTVRKNFLRQLVYETNVEKRVFDRAAVIKLAEQMAREKDFNIDPIAFVQSFDDKGIIHFPEGNVEITLPFIESYLLADDLVKKPDRALSYFNASDPEFDHAAFDLYCEIGPTPDVVGGVAAALKGATDALRDTSPAPSILLTDEIKPAIVTKRERLKALEGRLQKAFEDVVESRPNSGEKQHLLDIAGRLEEQAKVANERVARSSEDDASNSRDALVSALQLWVIASIAMGSASEHLNAPEKRALAQQIVQSTDVLLNEWMRTYPRQQFESFKKEVLDEDSLRATFAVKKEGPLDRDLVQFAEAIVDAYEFALISHPLRVMLQHICDYAGQKVLGASISKVPSGSPMENLIAGVWLAEVDPVAAKESLLRAIRELPPTAFLRLCLSQHFMMRVFWNHWELENRMVLLEAAECSLEPIGGGKIDRMKLRRLVGAKKVE